MFISTLLPQGFGVKPLPVCNAAISLLTLTITQSMTGIRSHYSVVTFWISKFQLDCCSTCPLPPEVFVMCAECVELSWGNMLIFCIDTDTTLLLDLLLRAGWIVQLIFALEDKAPTSLKWKFWDTDSSAHNTSFHSPKWHLWIVVPHKGFPECPRCYLGY